MKMVNLRKAKAELSALILLAWDPEFWKDLDERTRRGRKDSVTLEAFRKSVSRPGAGRGKRATPKRASPARRAR